MKIKNLPKKIYLNICSNEDEVDYNELDGVTFSTEKVGVTDCDTENVPYVNAASLWNNNDEVIGKEKGVSVYEAHKNINGTYSPVLPFPTNEKAFNDFIHHIAYFTGNKYLVTGDLLDETGTDGEPLIKNVKILKKL